MGTSSATNAQAFKAAMVQAMKDIVDATGLEVLVIFGAPGQEVVGWRDIVSFEALAADQSVATQGTSRSRDEDLRLTVGIECFRPGGQESEAIASDAAYALLGLLERHVRMTDTTVGGTVRHCFLTDHRGEGFRSPANAAKGRTYLIEATFTATARITA